MNDSFSRTIRLIRIAGIPLVSFLMVWGITRAASSSYQAQVEQIYKQAQADQSRMGLDMIKHRKELFAKFPCAVVNLASIPTVTPGGSVDITASGTFPDGTKFLFDYDEVEVVKEGTTSASAQRPRISVSGFLPAGTAMARSAAGSTYSATLRVSPKASFGFVGLHAFVPVSSGHTELPALFIGGKNNWEVSAKNGWRVSLKMQGSGFTLKENKKSAEGRYTAEFYRAGEGKPFETMQAVATYYDHQNDRHLTFSLSEQPSSYEAEMKQMSAKMSDPSFLAKMSEQEQEKFMNRFQELQMKMMQNMQAMIADPAAANREQAEFGCHTLQIRGGIDQGALLCGEKVGTVEITGIRTLVSGRP